MLWTVFAVFFVLWILGLMHTFEIGPWNWLFLVLAIAALLGEYADRRRKKLIPSRND